MAEINRRHWLFVTLATSATAALFGGCSKSEDAPTVTRPSTTRPVVPDDVVEEKKGAIPADLDIIPELGAATAQKMPDGEIYQKYKNGLLIFDVRPSVGRHPQLGETVHVAYKGMFPESGKVFDSADKDHPFEFRLGTKGIIKGWNLGVSTMTVGSKRRLWLPASLAYGTHGNLPTIPPNAPLIFEIELLGISGEAVDIPAVADARVPAAKPMGPAAPTSAPASAPAK